MVAEFKNPEELDECPEGTKVCLMFDDGSEWWGLYQGVSGNDIILKAEKGTGFGSVIGLPFDRLKGFIQEINDDQK